MVDADLLAASTLGTGGTMAPAVRTAAALTAAVLAALAADDNFLSHQQPAVPVPKLGW